ncbi:hypothetical protein HUG17_9250 [Dermatophagoides farinae]|nr:hypothetical protein HUG17_9250 [Dermatophagoides farinae]
MAADTIHLHFNDSKMTNDFHVHFDPFSNKSSSTSPTSSSSENLNEFKGKNDMPINFEPRKPFEALIQNDKTMADLVFDHTGRDLIYCELFDLEREPLPVRLPMVVGDRRPLIVSHKTMLEAVRRCTQLAMIQHQDVFIKRYTNQTTATTTAMSMMMMVTKPTNESSSSTTNVDDNNSTTIMSRIFSNDTITGEQPLFYNMTNNKMAQSNNAATPYEMNLQHYWTFWRGILPGTKWCGVGDVASHYEDLGIKLDIDLCCRAHDHCPIRLKAFRTGYGVFNLSFYSRLHCDCDEDFYNCLKKSPNSYATMLGQFYFNVLRVQCLKQDNNIPPVSDSSDTTPPVSQQVVCRKHRITTSGTNECIEYGIIPESATNGHMKIVPFGRHF